jgi:hypothetical protein
MSIQFACQCGKSLKAADEHAGKRAKCNQCGQVVTIPGVRQEVAKAAPMATPPVVSAPKKSTPAASTKVAIAALPKSDLDDFLFAEYPSAQSMGLVTKPQTANASAAAPKAPPKTELDDFLSTELAAAKEAASRSCPGCKQPLSNAAVICMKCGYNLKTGQKMNTYTSASSAKTEKRKPRRQSFLVRFLGSRLRSGKFMSGLAMMIGAVIWFVAGLSIGIIFFYPPILFIIGVVSFLSGLVDGESGG